MQLLLGYIGLLNAVVLAPVLPILVRTLEYIMYDSHRQIVRTNLVYSHWRSLSAINYSFLIHSTS